MGYLLGWRWHNLGEEAGGKTKKRRNLGRKKEEGRKKETVSEKR